MVLISANLKYVNLPTSGWFAYQKWWFSIAMLDHQKGIIPYRLEKGQ
jgi:hypothetical protein